MISSQAGGGPIVAPSASDVDAWIAAECVLDAAAYTAVEALARSWQGWCTRAGTSGQTYQSGWAFVSAALIARGCVPVRGLPGLCMAEGMRGVRLVG